MASLRATDRPSFSERLGHDRGERVVVVHVDDIGMCGSANVGALRALEGAATCGSIMVPCPAFEEIASIARERPDLDLGVHLTLNAEHEGYPWGPLRDDVPGLVSPDGGMWRTSRETVAHASPEEVDRELRAQIDRALEAGIDVTHLDVHMGTAFHLKFVAVYVGLLRDYRLPGFLPRVDRRALERHGLSPDLEAYFRLLEEVEEEGLPIFDSFDADSLHFEPGGGLEHNTRRAQGFAAGLSYLITHCAEGSEELERITADWRQRDEEHRIYSDGSMQQVFHEASIRTVGMRELRRLLHSG